MINSSKIIETGKLNDKRKHQVANGIIP